MLFLSSSFSSASSSSNNIFTHTPSDPSTVIAAFSLFPSSLAHIRYGRVHSRGVFLSTLTSRYYCSLASYHSWQKVTCSRSLSPPPARVPSRAPSPLFATSQSNPPMNKYVDRSISHDIWKWGWYKRIASSGNQSAPEGGKDRQPRRVSVPGWKSLNYVPGHGVDDNSRSRTVKSALGQVEKVFNPANASSPSGWLWCLHIDGNGKYSTIRVVVPSRS